MEPDGETIVDAAVEPGNGPDRSPLRELFIGAVDPEGRSPARRAAEELRTELRREASVPRGADAAPHDPAALRGEVRQWASAERRRFQMLFAQAGDATTREVLARRAALGCAPLALRSGAWLQWLTGPGNADDPVALAVLSLYASDVGVGCPRASRGEAYLGLLRQLRVAEHAVPAARIALNRRIGDGAFYLPAVLQSLSRRPDDLRDEILGADLCLRTVGLLPALVPVKEMLPAAVSWAAIDPGKARANGQPDDEQRCWAAVQALLASGADGAADRVALGFRWAFAALRRWSDELYIELDAARDPAFEMAELLRDRAAEGAVYHRDFQLGGRPLAERLRDCLTDPAPMLRALAVSHLVKPGNADVSALVNGLVSDRGPMFRVFAPEDLAAIRRWIDSLPSSPASSALSTAGSAGRVSPALVAALAEPPDPGRRPTDLREAYHMLQVRTDTAALREFAIGYARAWLGRSAYGIATAPRQLPPRWGPDGLRPWLAAQHARHDREFEAVAQDRVATREALVDSTVQLAPLTLIDGAWLQGFTDYEHAPSEVGFPLFETYWDELGNGEPRLNHPLIYRELLHQMGVSLPPTGSTAFARWSGFRETSFELPVYWLSIGRFPRTFLPEVLGLNIAMELSGVGGSYRQAHVALKKYGFSTRFVDIHNTIDNVASGHSAWAADAVDTYLASLGASSRAAAWQRIRVGYRSLNPPTGWRARRAGRRARSQGYRSAGDLGSR